MQIEEGDQKDSPSFRMDFPERFSATAADADPDENNNKKVGEDEDGDFEFSFIQIPESGPPIGADEIFSNGKILPVYPVFNRDLLLCADNDSSSSDFTVIQQQQEKKKKKSGVPLRRLFIEEEREQASFSSSSSSSSSSSLDELDAIPPGTYCVWNPNKDRCKKSNSTGSTPLSLRWKLKNLVVGRSKSDGGKDKFVFIPTIEKAAEMIGSRKEEGEGGSNNNNNNNNNNNKLDMMNKPRPREVDVVTAQQRTMQIRQDVGRTATGRKSYLPYNRNLVSLFNVNGLSRGQDPF